MAERPWTAVIETADAGDGNGVGTKSKYNLSTAELDAPRPTVPALRASSRPTPVPLAARKAAWAAGVQAEQTATQLAQRQTQQFRADDEPASETSPTSPELVQGYIADRHPKFGDLYREER